MNAPTLIYCADGNPRYAEIAIAAGFWYGAQLPNTIYHAPRFVDQDWRNPDRGKYMACLAQYRPDLATVLDWEHEDQLSEVLSWAEEATQHVNEVIIIPKVIDGIPKLPRAINGKPVRLGYSASTTFSGTSVPAWAFRGWPVHVLGGSPTTALRLARYLDVRSCDGNYLAMVGRRFGKFFTPDGYKHLRDLGMHKQRDGMYKAFELSCHGYKAAWQDYR